MSRSPLWPPSWSVRIAFVALCLMIAGCQTLHGTTEKLTKRSTSQGTVHIYEKVDVKQSHYTFWNDFKDFHHYYTYNILMPNGEQFTFTGTYSDFGESIPFVPRPDAFIDAWVASKENGTAFLWGPRVDTTYPGADLSKEVLVPDNPSNRKPPAQFLNLARVAPDELENFQTTSTTSTTSTDSVTTTTDVANDTASDTARSIASDVTQTLVEDAATDAGNNSAATSCTGVGIDAC